MIWSYFPFPPAREKYPWSLRLYQQTILCLPVQEVQARSFTMGCVKRHSRGLTAQECTRWNLFLVSFEFHPISITLNNQLNWITPNKSSKHWFWAINTVFPGDIQKLPGAGNQSGLSRPLEFIAIQLRKSASQTSAMLISSDVSWGLRWRGCQRSRKGGTSAAAQLVHWNCVWEAGSQTAIFLLFLDLCVCLKICTGSAI